jgi:hypothetical protein
MMNTAIAMNFVIPAETPILTFPLRGGRDDCFLSRKRERIEERVAGIQRIYSKGSWGLSRVASLVQLTGFPLSRE